MFGLWTPLVQPGEDDVREGREILKTYKGKLYDFFNYLPKQQTEYKEKKMFVLHIETLRGVAHSLYIKLMNCSCNTHVIVTSFIPTANGRFNNPQIRLQNLPK